MLSMEPKVVHAGNNATLEVDARATGRRPVEGDFTYTIKTDTNADQALSQAVIQGVTISIVPEPSSSLMTLVGGLAFLGFRRRKA